MSHWSNCLARAGAIVLSLGLPLVGIAAEENDEALDMDMLEFIGEWESPDGTWVDPMAMQQELEASPQKNSAVNEDTKDESR